MKPVIVGRALAPIARDGLKPVASTQSSNAMYRSWALETSDPALQR